MSATFQCFKILSSIGIQYSYSVYVILRYTVKMAEGQNGIIIPKRLTMDYEPWTWNP
jgi:hypothetical protein